MGKRWSQVMPMKNGGIKNQNNSSGTSTPYGGRTRSNTLASELSANTVGTRE